MTGYSATVRETSREFTAKEKVMAKDTTNAISMDSIIATKDDHFIMYPESYVVVDIHNEHSEDKDYVKYVIFDKDGKKYVTGSESFFSALLDIMADMQDCDEEWGIDCYKLPSKNYSGNFLTCSII